MHLRLPDAIQINIVKTRVQREVTLTLHCILSVGTLHSSTMGGEHRDSKCRSRLHSHASGASPIQLSTSPRSLKHKRNCTPLLETVDSEAICQSFNSNRLTSIVAIISIDVIRECMLMVVAFYHRDIISIFERSLFSE